MVSIIQPTTLIKTGIFNGDLESSVKRFNPNMEYLSVGLGNTNKYAIYDTQGDHYLLIIAQQKDKLISPTGHNTSLSITSYKDKKNIKIAKKFSNLSGIDLDLETPDWFKKNLQSMNLAFPIFEKNPEAAMKFLKMMGR